MPTKIGVIIPQKIKTGAIIAKQGIRTIPENPTRP